MPANVVGSPFTGQSGGNGKVSSRRNVKSNEQLRRKYQERYPTKEDYSPENRASDSLHSQHLTTLLELARESEGEMVGKRHQKWNEIDKMMTGFIDLTEQEEEDKLNYPSAPVSIVLPESFAVSETFLTYYMRVFGDRPFHRYRGTDPFDIVGAILMEKTIDFQNERARNLLALHTSWRNDTVYGFGPVTLRWVRKIEPRVVFDDIGYVDESGNVVITGTERKLEEKVVFEGNEYIAIDPYKALPDPNIPVWDVPSMSYFGWKDTTSYVDLLGDEFEEDSIFFNVEYMKDRHGLSSIYGADNTSREPDNQTKRHEDINEMSKPIDRIWMYVKLIPVDWSLGDGERPEVWLFCIAGEETIISAGKVDLTYDSGIPVASSAPLTSGYEELPISTIELNHGIQTIENYMANTMTADIRKRLLNQHIIDPKTVRYDDMLNAQLGGIIRTREKMWGHGVKDAIMPIPYTNGTDSHLDYISGFRSLSNQYTGAVDSIRGVQRTSGERVTAREFGSTAMNALSRLQKSAQLISMQKHFPLAVMSALNTQLLMSEEVYVETSGRWEPILRREYGGEERVRVTPFDLNVDYDVEISDGSFIGAENPEDWTALMRENANDPEFAQRFDKTRINLHIMRVLGHKNAFDFLRRGQDFVNPSVQPDEQVQNQAQAGNLVEVGEFANA
jgi:hypothetical protein